LAGSAGALAGPLLLTAVLAAGGSWRAGFLALALFAGLAWLGACRRRTPEPPVTEAAADEPEEPRPWTERARETLVALRTWKTLRWLLLIEVANLLVDVFTGFLALYLVDVVHLPPAGAALASLLYPAFLLVPGVVPKLAALAGLSAATATWYPVLQARLYGSLPGRSPVAVTLSS